MRKGKVIAIHITSEKGSPLHAVDAVNAVPGQGLEGDRAFRASETDGKIEPKREITLIESEALEALRRDYDIEISGAESRRNILTSGAALNHLVGRDFTVGHVVLRGLELCEPCGYLEKLTQKKGIMKGLRHRGGLRAQILEGGTIREGDSIEESPPC